jgi:lipopolysaccharide transport system ATP-binding protein
MYYGVRDIIAEITCNTESLGRLRAHEFWALHGAGFRLFRGESLGILGRNGAGKSTLLKLIAGLIKPDCGQLTVRGRVGALIALGAGFNPILSGRENIYISGAVLGYSKREIDRLYPDIVDFSELHDFIDMPVQNYSTGMHVRLGFAVAVHLEPDIMLVDEVLAVGDSGFQRKCFDRIYEMQNRGTSFIVVTHNPYQIERLCEKAAVVHHGRLSALCPGKEAVALYHDLEQQELVPHSGTAKEHREGTHALYFESIFIQDAGGSNVDTVLTNDSLRIVADICADQPLKDVRFRFEVCSTSNQIVTMVTTIGLTETTSFEGRHRIAFAMSPCQLTTGWYYVNAIAVDSHVRLDTWQRAAEFKVLLKDSSARNLSSDNGAFVCQGRWEL